MGMCKQLLAAKIPGHGRGAPKQAACAACKQLRSQSCMNCTGAGCVDFHTRCETMVTLLPGCPLSLVSRCCCAWPCEARLSRREAGHV